jgi:hypothetical protein
VAETSPVSLLEVGEASGRWKQSTFTTHVLLQVHHVVRNDLQT